MSARRESLTGAQAQSLVAAGEPWLSCDDCFEQVDHAVEVLVVDARVPDETLLVHLARCPACLEEAESLISLVAGDQGKPPEPILDTLRAEISLRS